MAIGKGSMARASKAVKEVKEAPAKEVVKEEVVKVVQVKETAVKKAPVKKTPAKKKPAATVVTPTKQVMDMATNDRIEIGDEMPIYLY